MLSRLCREKVAQDPFTRGLFYAHNAHFFIDKYAHYVYKKSMTAKELIKKLEAAGFVNKGGRNHDKLVHPDGRVTVVHRHKGDIPLGTLKAIARQTGIRLP